MKSILLRLVRTALITLAVGYLGVIALLSYFENRLVFRPAKFTETWVPPPSNEIQEIELTAADGCRLGAWWLPCPNSDRSILYLHGNAGNLSYRGGSMLKLREQLKGSVLIVDYPGYGKSEGSPSEDGCYCAADAAYEYLVSEQKVEPEKVILWGGSLGGGVAIDLAARKKHQALIVIKSFTSLPDVGSQRFPWIPVHLLMRNQFRSIDKISKIHTPVYIAHGDRDTVIPFEHGQRLFEAANQPKAFLTIPGNDHNDALPGELFTKVNAFLAEHAKK